MGALHSIIRFGLDPIAAMQRIYARHGALTQFSFRPSAKKPPRRYILAVGEHYNKRVLADPETFQSIGVMLPGPRDSAQRRISSGLLGPSNANHTHYRRMLLPPLRRAEVDALSQKIAAVVDREINAWPMGQPVDLFELCKSVARRASIETLFPASETGCSPEILEAARLINEHIEMESAPFVRGLPLNVPGLPFHRMLEHSKKVEAAIMAWANKEGAPPRPDNLMCLLASQSDENGGNACEKALLNHLPTLFAAAFETSQTALTWALFLLAQHPIAAAELLDEVSALPDDNPERYASCERLCATVRESMRLLPSVPSQTRRTTRPADLVDCDIDAGAYVILSAFLTNRNPDLFPEPNTFRPQRWSALNPSQYQYLAFSAGPRTCIGSWFATSLLRIAVARITQRFRICVRPDAQIDYQVRLTLRPGRTAMPVVIHPQDGRFQAVRVRGSLARIVEFETDKAAAHAPAMPKARAARKLRPA